MANLQQIIEGDSPVVIGMDALAMLDELLKQQFPDAKKFLLVDENTHQHCFPTVNMSVAQLENAHLIEFPGGEDNKTVEICHEIWMAMAEEGGDRHSLVINLGGGVVTDTGGFIAACFKRGIPFINVPTTLLSMVDAAVGGKTGVNLGHLKNQVGVFSDPVITLIYPGFLATLDGRQQLSGFAEMVKHALIADRDHLVELNALDWSNMDALMNAISRSIEIKAEITRQDPYERGLRKALNFGHTFGHAIESMFMGTDNHTLHGEAVAAGMILEAWLSQQLCGLPEEDCNNIAAFCHSVFPVLPLGADTEADLLGFMQHDKKNKGGAIRFALLEAIGTPKLDVECPPELIGQALTFYRETATAYTAQE